MSEFAHDVLCGLSKLQKELPSKYLYDELEDALIGPRQTVFRKDSDGFE